MVTIQPNSLRSVPFAAGDTGHALISGLIPTGNTQHAFVYHRSESLLLLLVVVVSTVAQVLLFILGKLHPAQHLHSQPVVNHLRAPLTVRQAQLGRALPEKKTKKQHTEVRTRQVREPSPLGMGRSDLPGAPPEPEVPASRRRAAERTPPGCLPGQECRSPR